MTDEAQRREQATAAALRAGLDLIQCGDRGGEPTFNLIDARGKRRRRVHVALTLDEVESVLNGTPNNICANEAANALGGLAETTGTEVAGRRSLREAMALPYGDYDGTPVEVDHEKLAADRANIAAQIEREKAPRPRSPKLEDSRKYFASEEGKAAIVEMAAESKRRELATNRAKITRMIKNPPSEPMSADEARGITAAIRTGLEQLWELIVAAYTGRAWIALGHASWDDYCSAEFGASHLRLPRGERTAVVSFLRDAGMSVRAIAAATGISKDTAHRALEAGVSNETADAESVIDETEVIEADVLVEEPIATVTGIDGKRHPAKKKPPAPRKGNTLPPEVIEHDQADVNEEEPTEEPVLSSFELDFWNDPDTPAGMDAFFTTGTGDRDMVTIEFGDPIPEKLPPVIAAELAKRIKAVVPEIIKLGALLERRGAEEQS